ISVHNDTNNNDLHLCYSFYLLNCAAFEQHHNLRTQLILDHFMQKKRPVTATIATGLALNLSVIAYADETAQDANTQTDIVMEAINVTASADASASGLPPEYAGGQVAAGG